MHRLLKILSLLVLLLLPVLSTPVAVSSASASAHRAAPRTSLCRVPRLKGLTVAKARIRAAHVHCKLHVAGARLEKPGVQIVKRQYPAPARRSKSVTVWIKPAVTRQTKRTVPSPTSPPVTVPAEPPVAAPTTPLATVPIKPILCSVPNLTGLTLADAQIVVTNAGCTLQVEGASPGGAYVQTVARQSPEALQLSESVTVWLNPLCWGSAARGPGESGWSVTPGPTELVAGFYLAGGPPIQFSTPECKLPEPAPEAGTVEVMDEHGALVATATSARGQFVEIPLPTGSYTVRGTFLEASINGVHPSQTVSVEIPPGHTVRWSFVLEIP